MINYLKKLWDLFNRKERLQILGILVAILFMAFTQLVGVGTSFAFTLPKKQRKV